jgi:hypothetical protein
VSREDWYARRDELEPEQVFRSWLGVVKLDHRVPGDATRWRVANWWGKSWAYCEDTIEPGDLIERLPDGWTGEVRS